MLKKYTVLTTAMLAAFGMPSGAVAADNKEIIQLREEIRQMKQDYESRMRALEKRLQAAESGEPAVRTASAPVSGKPADLAASAPAPIPVAAAAPVGQGTSSASAFNPAISAILNGTYANLSRDPSTYRIQGFVPGGEEIGPGKRGFSLGESEVTLSANIDPFFSGQMTFALAPDDSVSVEEAFFQAKGLAHGVNLKGGRFLSSVGYLNSFHAHSWDFVDMPLAYQAFVGGQYRTDGLQLRWVAPTERFFELGFEAGDGGSFPGSQRDKNGIGSTALFAHVGDDIGQSGSWRAGLSYIHNRPKNRTYEDTDSMGAAVTNSFSGSSNIWIADAVYKWAPGGNATQTNLKLQGEYFRRKESGTLTFDTLSDSFGPVAGNYSSAQSGWYLQGVYQFMPQWRAGLRYDKLYSGTPDIGLIDSGLLAREDLPGLSPYNPSRASLMIDFSPSEFSRLRLQYARDKARLNETDNQFFIQYIMSLGAHGAHAF